MEFLRLRSLALPLLVLPLLLSSVATANAAEEWTSRGPFCSRPFGLVGNNRISYLAVGGDLFRSRDGWADWSQVGADLPTSYLSAVAAAPRNPRLVYFAVWDGGGVFRSRDGGETWTQVFLGLPDQLVQDLVVPAGPPGTVFAIAPYSGFYRSRDQGETWTNVSPPDGASNYLELIPHPLRPERLVARTHRGVWRSNDGGDTWKSWNAGLPVSNGEIAGLGGLTIAPDDQDTAFVTVYQTLYRSQKGRPWKRVGQVPVNSFAFVNTLLAGPGATPVLLAGQDGITTATPGVLRSRDGGKTWKPVPLLGETVYRLSYLPALGRVVALTASGAFYSRDFGTTWQRTGSGVAASRVKALTTAGRNDRILVAGLEACPSGLARSADGGRTWTIQEIRKPGVHHSPGSGAEIEALASAPSRPLRVYAVGMDQVLRSEDGGLTWKHFSFNDGISGGRSAAVVVHPTNPDLVFVAGQHGLSRSSNGGRTWSGGLHEYPFNDMSAVAFAPGQPERMLAASWYGGLTRSADTGATWEPIPGTDFLRASALAFDPRNPDVVLASTLFDDIRIYRSTDGGTTWEASDIGTEGTIRHLTFSTDGTEVVAAGEGGVFLSRDGGRTWQRVEGAPAPAKAIALQKNGILHVGTDAGVVSSQTPVSQP